MDVDQIFDQIKLEFQNVDDDVIWEYIFVCEEDNLTISVEGFRSSME